MAEDRRLSDIQAQMNAALPAGRHLTAWILCATDGYLGEIIDRDPQTGALIICKASWVAETGRRHQFAAGDLSGAEIEVYPPDMHISIPMELGPVIHAWPYPLPTATQ